MWKLLSKIVRKFYQISNPSVLSCIFQCFKLYLSFQPCLKEIIRICSAFLPGSWHLRKTRLSSHRTTQRTWFYHGEYLYTSTSSWMRVQIFFLFFFFFYRCNGNAILERFAFVSQEVVQECVFQFPRSIHLSSICEKSLFGYNGYRGPKLVGLQFFSNTSWPPERKQMAWRISRSTGNYQLEGIPRVIKRSDVAVPSGKATLRATLRLHTLSVLKPTGKTYRILLNMSDLRLSISGKPHRKWLYLTSICCSFPFHRSNRFHILRKNKPNFDFEGHLIINSSI